MPVARVSIAAQGAQEWRDLAKRLRKAGTEGQELRKALRRKISDAGKPAVDDVKAAVRDLQVTSSHGGGTGQRRQFAASRARATAKVDLARAQQRARRRGAGLRATIASATRLQITTKGVRIIVNSSRLPENQRTLPRHLDSEKGWRHPVFGNTANWVEQRGGPYFATTIQKRAGDFRQACLDAIDETNAELGQ